MDTLLKTLKAAADKSRLRILAALTRHKELCACQLTALLGTSGPTVSRHLALLVEAGLLASRKEGRWVFFRLAEHPALPLGKWLSGKDDPALARDAELLAKITSRDRYELCRAQRGQTCCP